MKLFDATLDLLSRSMDARMLRHGVLAGNLANAETPGYQPKDVDFNAALAQAQSQSQSQSQSALPAPSMPAHEGFIPVGTPAPPAPAGPAIIDAANTSAGLDGNKVDSDRTLVALAQNALQYGAAAKAATKKLALLRYVASDGNA